MYATVLITESPGNFDQILTYSIPVELTVQAGSLVAVPVRRKIVKGLVLSVEENRPNLSRIKEIAQVLIQEPVVTGCGLELARWIADYYVCSLNKVFQLFFPPPVRMKGKVVYSLVFPLLPGELLLQEEERQILDLFRSNQARSFTSEEIRRKMRRPVQQDLEYLLNNKYIQAKQVFNPQVTSKENIIFSIKEGIGEFEEILKRAPIQKRIMEKLKKAPHALNDLKEIGLYNRPALKALYEKQLIEISREGITRSPFREILKKTRPQSINSDQRQACETISNSIREGKGKWLLFGVTGSGKTEVYLRIMEEALALGKQVLYLVPEISLTPQVISLLLDVFGERVAVLHSALSAGERYDEWMKIRVGEARVILGPRSAVFAPFTDLGLIIIDEEHENTYKQNEPDPRYDARCVAEKLADLSKAVLVMGSATPSLRTFYLTAKGHYGLLQLPSRVASRPLPAIEIVDMKKEIKEGNTSIFSTKLLTALQQTLDAGEQAILFMNRRGFHTYVMCRECGKPLTCPHCSITLIYHRTRNKLACHYCHYQRFVPKNCPFCGSSYIRYYGTGTERVAEELTRVLPGIPFLRMDTDTTQNKDSHTRILKEFQEGRARVLIGTQMVAKGLDFPRVTLVGIINPDFLLNMPDYQAGERAYQLMTQVAGRAGRGQEPGRVFIQTYDPEHYLFSSVIRQNYEEFYAQEITIRSNLQYPPFYHLARILVSGYNEKQVVQRIELWLEILQQKSIKFAKDVELLGPTPAPLGFLNKRFRYHIIIKSNKLELVQNLARQVREKALQYGEEPRTVIDIQPQSLL